MEFLAPLSLSSVALDFLAGTAFAAELAGHLPFPFSYRFSSAREELRGPGRFFVSG